MATSMTFRRTTVALATVGALLAGCGGGGSDAVGGDTTPETAQSATSPVTNPVSTEVPVDDERCAIRTGDREFEPVPCDQPHDAEMAGVVAGLDDPAPDDPFEATLQQVELCEPVVTALTSRPSDRYGLDMVADPVVEAGEPYPDEFECWAAMSSANVLSTTMVGTGVEAALGDFAFIDNLDPGTCYTLPDPDGYVVVLAVSCDDDPEEQVLANVELERVEFGDDADVLAEAEALCDVAGLDLDFVPLSDELFTLKPDESQFVAFGNRTVICGAIASTGGQQSNGDEVSLESPCAGDVEEGFPGAPCDEPHDAEYVGDVKLSGDTLPLLDAEMSTLAFTGCRDQVEAATGRSMKMGGIVIGYNFDFDAEQGGPNSGNVRCFVSTKLVDGLLGTISEIGLDAALGDRVIVQDQEGGTCFVLGDEINYSLVRLVGCDDPEALVFIGSFEVDADEYPGIDTLREIRTERCGEILAEAGLDVDPSTVSGNLPDEGVWTLYDNRLVTCDGVPST